MSVQSKKRKSLHAIIPPCVLCTVDSVVEMGQTELKLDDCI